jgi:RNA polymerase sigma-70 factor (ECF subfamily)
MESASTTRDPDIALIRGIAEGEEGALEELVTKYQRRVLNTIYRYIGDPEEAEDLAQEVFVKVWRGAGGFRGKSKVSTWIYRIAVNHCLSHRAKRKTRVESLDEIQERGGIPEATKVEVDRERERRAELVRDAVGELPERQRMALILSKFEGRSYKEISEIMGTTLSSVESLIFRAKDNLGKKLLPLRERGEI